MKVKILYVIDGMEFGGGERVFTQIINGLPLDQYELFLASGPKESLYQAISQTPVQRYPIDFSNRFNPTILFHLVKIIKDHRIDIVHSQGARTDFYARIAGRISRVQHNVCTIAMPVEGFDVSSIRKRIYRTIDCLTEKYVEKFITVSDFLNKMLIEKRGIPAAKVVRIYNGVELHRYHPDAGRGKLKKELGIPEDVPLIGAVGRMVWQKGFEFLIKAAPAILQAFPGARFMIVGDGPLRGKLGALSEELRVKDNVIFAGFRSDIKDVLSAIDLLVVPSLLEGFPMVTLEAMAMAKPIIATKIDGITEQITDGENGILVPPKDHNALSKAILRLIQDKELSKKLGMSARKKVEQEFSVEKMVAETEKVYLSLLGTN